MTAADLLDDLMRMGVQLSVSDGHLRYSGPRHVLTSDVIEDLRAHKAELVELVQVRDREVSAVLQWPVIWLNQLPLPTRLLVRSRRGIRSLPASELGRRAPGLQTKVRDVLQKMDVELVAVQAVDTEETKAVG